MRLLPPPPQAEFKALYLDPKVKEDLTSMWWSVAFRGDRGAFPLRPCILTVKVIVREKDEMEGALMIQNGDVTIQDVIRRHDRKLSSFLEISADRIANTARTLGPHSLMAPGGAATHHARLSLHAAIQAKKVII